MGTPVLVFAALGWIFRTIGGRFWARITGKTYESEDSGDETADEGGAGDEEKGGDRWLSRAYVTHLIKRLTV